jgi:hypothetical protein
MMDTDDIAKMWTDKELQDYEFMMQASPVSWRFKAKRLKHAADRLCTICLEGSRRNRENLLAYHAKEGTLEGYEDDELLWDSLIISEAFLLIGYAIENLLKGLLIAKFPEKIKLTSQMQLGSHNLPQIAKECDLDQLSVRQVELLRSLELTIKWAGKYPIPLKASDVRYGELIAFKDDELEEKYRTEYQEMVDLYTLILTEHKSYPNRLEWQPESL